jgi:hypothetical protein
LIGLGSKRNAAEVSSLVGYTISVSRLNRDSNEARRIAANIAKLPGLRRFEETLRGKDSLLCGLVQSRSTSGCAFSEDGVRREEARISTGVASEFSEVGGSIRSSTGDVNSSLNASRAHAVAI